MTNQPGPKAVLPPGLLDRRRGLEHVEVFYGGDASRLLDISRAALIFDSEDGLRQSLDRLRDNPEVVHLEDRITNPAPDGYRDVAVYVRASNGHISTMRLLLAHILETKHLALPLFEKVSALEARRYVRARNHTVIVLDMFRYGEADGRFMIDGFPTFEAARDYARRRTFDSVEQLRMNGQSPKELQELWLVFGEDVLAVGEEDAQTYSGFSELDRMVTIPASDRDRDWASIGDQYDLGLQRILRHVVGKELEGVLTKHREWAEARRRDVGRAGLETALGKALVDTLVEGGGEIVAPHEQTELEVDGRSAGERANLRGAVIYSFAGDEGKILENAYLEAALLDDAVLARVAFSNVDLDEASMRRADLRGAWIGNASLTAADLTNADLREAYLREGRLRYATLMGADLRGAFLSGSDLTAANLQGADLRGAYLDGVDFSKAKLVGADLSGTNISGARLVSTSLQGTILKGARIYGVSVWDASVDETTNQTDLIITPTSEPDITVDNIEVGQFIYLLLRNEKIRHVIDTVTSKVVLILGRFTDERKVYLDAIRSELRQSHNLSPVLFDFAAAPSRDLTETISTLAHMSRFVIADLTEARSLPQELSVIVPNLPSVPVLPLLQVNATEYAMFEHFRRYPWVLEVHRYEDLNALVASLPEVIGPASEMAQRLREPRRPGSAQR